MPILHSISPYRDAATGRWVFDDPSVDLVKEPFIRGADRIIEELIRREGIRDPDAGFNLVFSDSPFPCAQIELVRLHDENGGTWYLCKRFGMDGWLCPALLKYYPMAPERLYVEALSRLTAISPQS